jgi:hypothetical protein
MRRHALAFPGGMSGFKDISPSKPEMDAQMGAAPQAGAICAAKTKAIRLREHWNKYFYPPFCAVFRFTAGVY